MRHEAVFAAALLPAHEPLVQILFVVFILHVLATDRDRNKLKQIDEVVRPANN
jgi:hypothetical protein